MDELAERRIAEAQARGEFDDLPGAGAPLPPDDIDPLVPAELRMAYRVLKNAGYVPEGVRLRREIHDVEALVHAAISVEQREDATRRLQLLVSRLGSDRGGCMQLQEQYYAQLAARINRSTD